jgi:hypothetical protein
MHEFRFAGDALRDLLRTLAGGLRTGAFARDADAVRRVRESLERCQNEVREIIREASAGMPAQSARSKAAGGEPTRPTAPGEDYV